MKKVILLLISLMLTVNFMGCKNSSEHSSSEQPMASEEKTLEYPGSEEASEYSEEEEEEVQPVLEKE